jgi:adenylosuccinate synthase
VLVSVVRCVVLKVYLSVTGSSLTGEGPFPTELLAELGETLRARGHEYGTTTGRPRRCGWIDIPQLKYALALNGIDEINLTKLDVLTGFPEVVIGARYLHPDGTECTAMPSDLRTYAALTVAWERMPGWEEDISKCKTFEELPLNCRRYVERLEVLLNQPIKYIGVGPGREDLIVKLVK